MYLRRLGIGHLLFASSFILIGAISLGLHDFVLFQQPVPHGIPWRVPLACISAALLLLPGVGLLLERTARQSALILTAFVALWIFALWLPQVLAHPAVELNWLGVGEDTVLATGGWLIYCEVSGRSDGSVRLARLAFGLALVPIGLSHFFYLDSAANFIPAWMPLHVPLTIIAGAGHIAAGVAIACGVVPRLAAILEAGMETLITLIVWVSAIATKPGDHQSWIGLFLSTAETAAAFVVAASYLAHVERSRLGMREAPAG
ncbi:MAG TPA: DoxX family membrane protein [Steroidobacteraceae bacterium]|nr:DoxX family membrane protein [Steroidobacteraceae bacterium]